MDVSGFSFNSKLSSRKINNLYSSNQKDDNYEDVVLDQLLDAGNIVDDLNMKTVTRKDLIEIYELKIENQKKLH